MPRIWLLNFVAFLAAFLLFQIELIIAKIFLPHYGGSYLVWGACVVFFQAALLLGYIFAHVLIERVGIGKYRFIHLLLFVLPLLVFPGRSLPALQESGHIPLVLDVFFQLFLTIGLVFFVLSTVSIITQSWVAASELNEKRHPYSLYAFSNLGSFAALLSYPFLFEYYFGLSEQIFFWRSGYFVLLIAQWLLFIFVKICPQEQNEQKSVPRPSMQTIAYWFLLGAIGVIMFLAVTNIVTNEIAPIPLFWVISLSIYLLAFVFNFRENSMCPEWIKKNILSIIGGGVLLYLATTAYLLPVILAFILYYILLFCVCMYCQNELYVTRPEDKENLTFFYVIFSLGSFVGGLLVSWIVPLLSTSFVELLIGLLLLGVICLVKADNDKTRDRFLRLIFVTLVFILQDYYWVGAVILIGAGVFIISKVVEKPKILFYVLIPILFFSPRIFDMAWQNADIFRDRNYYGILRVNDTPDYRFFVHGTTLHGAQYPSETTRKIPITFYHPLTGVGQVLTTPHFSFKNIGVIGLGTGSLSAYAKEDQSIDFFELDPIVHKIATEYFTYLEDSPANIQHYFGDARLMLKSLPKKKYDILVIDAFGGDSVPIHLVTVEALRLYKEMIKEDGIVLFHYSNRYVDLRPILAKNALLQEAFFADKKNKPNTSIGLWTSFWFAVTWDGQKYQTLIKYLYWKELDQSQITHVRPWTDNYSNIFPYVIFNNFFRRYKSL